MKILNGVLLLMLSLPFSGITQTYSTGRIANTQYSDFDVPVYTIDVVIDFNADNTGATDAPAETGAALNMADSLYGGIVYLPSGSYLIENPLTIPEQVTLRGDWKRPTDLDKTVAGTVLVTNHGVGDTIAL